MLLVRTCPFLGLAQLESSLSVGSFLRFQSEALLVSGALCLLRWLLVFLVMSPCAEELQLGSSYSDASFGRLGSSLSTYGRTVVGQSLSVVESLSLGRSVSIASFTRLGSSVSTSSSGIFGSSVSVLVIIIIIIFVFLSRGFLLNKTFSRVLRAMNYDFYFGSLPSGKALCWIWSVSESRAVIQILPQPIQITISSIFLRLFPDFDLGIVKSADNIFSLSLMC
jgi:hypothetical protein